MRRGAFELGLSLVLPVGDRFKGLGYEATPDGAVFLADAGAWLECSVGQENAAADHDIILFRLHRAATAEGIMSLVFHSSVFHTLTPIG
ncbi:flavin reductase family protein [uncultured Sphingomonas sp.]|uniref:flavin reductase family protein n=1 Tax=uncultured Sphingomonas sp. TaxID=158754 RepID=UPI00345D7A34